MLQSSRPLALICVKLLHLEERIMDNESVIKMHFTWNFQDDDDDFAAFITNCN